MPNTIIISPFEWVKATIGKSYDTDKAYGPQCWDYFDYFCRCIGCKASRYCNKTGYAGDLYRNFATAGFGANFERISDVSKIHTGDWVFWDRHVAMYYNGKEIGQNQPYKYVSEKTMNWNGVIGAMRPKIWADYSKSGTAEKYDKNKAGTYKTTCAVNLRCGPDTAFASMEILPKGKTVQCYGYYSVLDINNGPWYYVVSGNKQGFVSAKYLLKEGEKK